MSRRPLIAGNWKMNLDHLQGIALVQKLAWTLKDAKVDPKSVEMHTTLSAHPFLLDLPPGKYQLRIGAQVYLSEPRGEFYLRPATAPILCVAGGSGLAPIKAMLEQALREQCRREEAPPHPDVFVLIRP